MFCIIKNNKGEQSIIIETENKSSKTKKIECQVM